MTVDNVITVYNAKVLDDGVVRLLGKEADEHIDLETNADIYAYSIALFIEMFSPVSIAYTRNANGELINLSINLIK